VTSSEHQNPNKYIQMSFSGGRATQETRDPRSTGEAVQPWAGGQEGKVDRWGQGERQGDPEPGSFIWLQIPELSPAQASGS
jgi:hypothetical protein